MESDYFSRLLKVLGQLVVVFYMEVSADNRLSLAKSLVTTGCHQQKVCWQPAVFSNTTVYLPIYLSLVAF